MATIEKPDTSESSFLGALIRLILRLEVFLLPLFFLPYSFEAFEFGKQNLLWLLTFFAAVLWLWQNVIIAKKIHYRRTPLDLPMAAFLIIWGLSSFFSLDRFTSFFGYYGRFSDAYLGTLACALFYFLIIQTANHRQLIKLFNAFFYSLSAVFLISLISFSGVLMKLPDSLGFFNLIRSAAFNTVSGASEPLAMLAAAVVVLTAVLYSWRRRGDDGKNGVSNIKLYWIFGLALAALMLVNFTAAWAEMIFGLAAFFFFALYISYSRRGSDDRPISISISPSLALLIISFAWLLMFSSGTFNLSQTLFKNSLPREVRLSVESSAPAIWSSLRQYPLFGSGPGTFVYDFSAFRPASFNASQFWQLRFDKAPAYILEIIATAGVLGTLSYLLLAGVFLFVSFIFLKNIFRSESEESYWSLGFSFMALALFIGQGLYWSTTVLQFIFWFGLAFTMANWRVAFAKIFADKEIDLRLRAELYPISAAAVFTAVGMFIALLITQARLSLADFNYNSFRLSGNRGKLIKAVELNPGRLNYHLALAADYLSEVKDEISALSSGSPADKSRQAAIQTNVQLALKEGEAATRAAPKSVMAWEELGSIYRDIRQIAVGSLPPAIRYFRQASDLEPANPVLLTELGKLYLENKQTKEAADAFERAVAAKGNYWEAKAGLAKTYEALDQPDKALVILEETITVQPAPELIYESGRLYYNSGKLEQAIERFQQAIAARPDYANAIYSLGLAYQKQGDKARALEQFNRVLKLNPGNEGVRSVIEELSKNETPVEELKEEK